MKRPPSHAPNHSPDALSLLLAQARAHENSRCAKAFSDRLDELATHIYNYRLGWCDVTELLRQEASKLENQSQEWH